MSKDDDQDDNDLGRPLPPLFDDQPKPTPTPAWVSLLATWLGLLTLAASAVLPLLPGSRNPREELEHFRPYSLADRFVPWPIYGSVVSIFLGIVVLWQMRKEPRPLPEAMVYQRVQAWVGIVLGLLAAAVVYVWVALRGPK